MSETVRKWFYPTEEQWDRWQDEMEARGFETPNQFVQAMVEAGLKKFGASDLEPDETADELREERNELKAELDNAQQRIDSLERELQYTDQGAAIRFLEENPDADYPEVVEHVQDTAPDRVTRFFEEFEEAHAGRTFDGREIDTSDIPGGKLPFSDEEDNE